MVLPRLKSDFYDLIEAAVEGREFETEWKEESVLGVVMAAIGYPGKYEKGYPVRGLEDIKPPVYHMGTAWRDGKTLTVGGRVLMVLGEGDTLAAARKAAYDAVGKVDCSGLFNRSDIGAKEA